MAREEQPGPLAPHLQPDPGLLGREWAALVEADREQVERLREMPAGSEHWEILAPHFVADPRRRDDAILDALRACSGPERVWLDVGAGAGRYALPLALASRQVIAVEPSPAMRGFLLDAARQHGIANLDVRAASWPEGAAGIEADYSLMSHVGYDVPEITRFIDALEAATRARCFALLMDRVPNSGFEHLWREIHGEERVRLPAAREFVHLLLTRGALPELRVFPSDRHPYSEDDVRRDARRRLWLREGSEKDRQVQALLDQVLTAGAQDFQLPSAVALISWAPPR
ncbi:MAG TPA: methyltransferase domain-containing protein [Thermomicrobiaceae bacterium]|nr:methyltransferase domain-containing protein [Thermomicrobiaceae bacterium]